MGEDTRKDMFDRGINKMEHRGLTFRLDNSSKSWKKVPCFMCVNPSDVLEEVIMFAKTDKLEK